MSIKARLLFGLMSALLLEDVDAAEAPQLTLRSESIYSEEAQAPGVEYKDPYSPALAALLNFVLPSAGFFYTESYGWAVTQIAVMGVGMAVVAWGASKGNNRNRYDSGEENWDGLGEVLVGMGIMAVGHVGGLIAAPIVASSKNRAAREGFVSQDSSQVPDSYGLKIGVSF